MDEGVDASDFDVLVLAGPGVGHYHPIAALLPHLCSPERVAISAQVPHDHPMVAKAASDGVTFLPWPDEATGTGGRVLRRARRWLQHDVVPRLAASGDPGADLPSVMCRTVFALSSLLAPLSDASPERGRALDQLVERTRPRLVLTEGNEDWMAALAARHDVAWAYYATGPVSTVVSGRPVGPAGFPPTLEGARFANSLLLVSKRLRNRVRLRRIDRAARERFGVGRTTEPIAKLAFSAAELDAYPGVAGHDVEYAGLYPYRPPSWWSTAATGAEGQPERDTVLVTWGSGASAHEAALMAQLVPVLVELSAELRVVVVSGDPQLRGTLTTHPGLHALEPEDAPPYDEMRRARLVITHGGYGTIKEAVALGAPVLVAAELVADRMETSQRVRTAGVGRSVNRYAVHSEQLRAVVRELLDDQQIAATVDRVGAALRTPNAELVARLVRAVGTEG